MEECKTNLHSRFHYKGKICGNFGNHKRTKHKHGKDHIIREAVVDRIVDVIKIATENNLADPLTKTLVTKKFNEHVEGMGMRDMTRLWH